MNAASAAAARVLPALNALSRCHRSDPARQHQGGHDAGQRAETDLLLEADLHRESLRENDREKAPRNQHPAPGLGDLECGARGGCNDRREHDTKRRNSDDRCLQRPWEGREGGAHGPQLVGTSRYRLTTEPPAPTAEAETW